MGSDNIAQSVGKGIGSIGKYNPETEHRRSFVSLRWLVIILSSYLVLFSNFSDPSFPVLLGLSALFAATNVVLAFVSDEWFESEFAQRAIVISDLVFVTITFFALRVPGTYFYIGFALIFILALVSRDFRIVMLALLIVSVLFGVFNAFRLQHFALTVSIEGFLTLSLFFVVSIFYVFLSRQFEVDARLSRAILQEKRNAEIMVEIARGLSSSLKTEDVLRVVVTRLCEVVDAKECAIIGVDAKTGEAYTMVRVPHTPVDVADKDDLVDINNVPELKEAYDQRTIVFRDIGENSVVAVPMISQDAVLGLIHVIGKNTGEPPSDAVIRFFEVMASTAGNALRNAQLFEEVEQRARTDFMTGLANHRYFQMTLSSELGRAQRHNRPLSLLMIDLDYLKLVNDRFGHPSGDTVIRTIAETIRQSCRDFDFAARYGGEEFTVILPETSLEAAINVAERMRQTISQVRFSGIGNVTASLGVSNYPLNALNKDDLIRVADQALYLAKNGGRDRVAYFSYQLVNK